MKRVFSIITILFLSLNTVAQSEKDGIIVVQKFYYDTLQSDYRKVKFEINKKADKVTQLDYSSAHISDTIIVREITEYIFENGSFVLTKLKAADKEADINNRKKKDTVINKNEDYTTKKVFLKNKITYAARFLNEDLLIPLNEVQFIYDKNGKLIRIDETYKCADACEMYKTVFEYKDKIVSRMTEYKLFETNWKKQKIWEYELLTKSKIPKKSKKRINRLLLNDQFLELPW